MPCKPKVFGEKEVQKRIEALSEWVPNKKHTQLSKTFTFPSFITALAFVAKITVHAEVIDHHPTIELSYGKVKVKLATHEPKGLTTKDFDLAKRIDRLRLT
ncbi:MAG: 4a-hydroxytetrahydrobiopterin dehydratase [Candidatus Pacebacteria bacterium]|nr:4a-hydroxytetrahydrobiopterin dehydratase [Candidatus Paceibacterota bacterium]